MNVLLVDDVKTFQQLLPLTYTRPISYLRVGIFTLIEKWEHWLDTKEISCFTEEYLQKKYKPVIADENLFISSSVLPSEEVVEKITSLENGQSLFYQDDFVAFRGKSLENAEVSTRIFLRTSPVFLHHYWDLFQNNGEEIKKDFAFVKKESSTECLYDPYTRVYGEHNLFIEQGAEVRAAIIDADSGPVYIGKNVKINEGAIIKGPFAICEGASVSMGAKIRQATTIGPYSNVGGEVKNSIVIGHSNKGHEGYMGNSILGEWCNLGADTNTSNLKNNFGEVKVWNYATEQLEKTNQLNCGLIMGDHSKAGVNTMFNTGTVVGAFVNVFGGGFPAKHLPSFSWENDEQTFELEKGIMMAKRMMHYFGKDLSQEDEEIYRHIFDVTERFRF
ncbi:MAG: glucose-1-phosphate thymidylyltransferase [Cytophagales bacterium]|nr:glucose-1-phosphate thymidylyltransferase [Cytophagales bacterium]